MLKKIYYWLHRKISRPEERGEYSAGYWQSLIRKTALEKCPRHAGVILEVGCGEGLFLAELAKKNPDVRIVGVDIWKEVLFRAQKRMQNLGFIKKVELLNADAKALPFKDNSFNAVVCVNVLFNMRSEEDAFKTLQEISGVCKIGGRIIFDMRNSLNPLIFIKYKLARFYDETVKDMPLKTYNPKAISVYLERCGMKIINKTCLGFPYNNCSPIIVFEVEK